MNLDNLFEAIQTWTTINTEYDKQYEAYDGVSWDYEASYIIDKLKEARIDLHAKFQIVIDEAVRKALKNQTGIDHE